ncbi:MAG: DMT family transporter [Roseitalea porphyridii]|uniref:DMT family transporter n=1 Tax=Roseitalea porphyridii TaxID=1852022 RepID=UPI0032D918A8
MRDRAAADIGGTERPALGVGLMVAAMLAIPVVDATAKHLAADYSPLFISWARYAVASVLIVPLGLVRFGPAIFPRHDLGAHTLRTLFLVGAMTLYFVAIATVPLATAISAFFVGPIVASALAVFLLGERFSPRKAVSVVLGFAGALVIVDPTGGGIEPGLLLAVASGVLFGLYLLATRQAARRSDPVKTLIFQCVVGALILTPQAIHAWEWVDLADLGFFALLGGLSVVSHMLSINAFRFAEASTLSPIVYVELIGAVIIGYLVFGDLPGLNVWLGAAAIVAAGLLLLRAAERR